MSKYSGEMPIKMTTLDTLKSNDRVEEEEVLKKFMPKNVIK